MRHDTGWCPDAVAAKGFWIWPFQSLTANVPEIPPFLVVPFILQSLKAVRLEAPDLKAELSHSLAFLQGAQPGAFVVPKSKTKQGVGTHNAPLTEGLSLSIYRIDQKFSFSR